MWTQTRRVSSQQASQISPPKAKVSHRTRSIWPLCFAPVFRFGSAAQHSVLVNIAQSSSFSRSYARSFVGSVAQLLMRWGVSPACQPPIHYPLPDCSQCVYCEAMSKDSKAVVRAEAHEPASCHFFYEDGVKSYEPSLATGSGRVTRSIWISRFIAWVDTVSCNLAWSSRIQSTIPPMRTMRTRTTRSEAPRKRMWPMRTSSNRGRYGWLGIPRDTNRSCRNPR